MDGCPICRITATCFILRSLQKVARLPKKVDLQAKCSPVEDQGRLGSCTANSLVGALEFLEKKDGVPFVDLSRLFVYYNERVIESTVDEDNGIKSLAKQGVCPEQQWPYIVDKTTFKKKPSAGCYTAAKKHRIISYLRINTVDEMRSCLADGFPFVFGFTVCESFESRAVAKSGVLNMPKRKERVVGGHAVMVAGYNDREKRFLIRNSWGSDWGRKGCFTMPFAYLADRNLSDDFWIIRASEEG
jgi:C1A family cysteine protease